MLAARAEPVETRAELEGSDDADDGPSARDVI